jgi:hypothetical protein
VSDTLREKREKSVRWSCGCTCCHGEANQQSPKAKHSFMDSRCLNCCADNGNDSCDGDTPFATQFVCDRASKRHGNDRSNKDDGYIESNQRRVKAEILSVLWDNLETILPWLC